MRFFFLPLALVCVAFPAFAQPQPTPSPTPIPESVQAMADRVLKETGAIRGLTVKRTVPTRVFSSAQIEAFMAKDLQTQAKANEIKAAELYLRQLGLAPKNFDLKNSYTRLLGEQVAGFYDTRTHAFTTSSRVAPLQLETVMAHELTHALQDQHFDLGRTDTWPKHESDSRIAFSGLIEGDATLVMTRYMTANPLRAFGVVVSSLGEIGKSNTALLNSTPRILLETLQFPYTSGLQFVTRLHARGGWDAVSRAYKRPPASTQQILHFDLYWQNKAPEKVAVPDVSRVLGSGWKLLDHDVNGELGLSQVVNEFVDAATARAAASGWSGDRYAVFTGPKGAVLVVQNSLWNDAASASKWRAAYATRTQNRFAGQSEEKRDGAISSWNVASDGVWLEQKGRRVVMLEGTVGSFNAKRVLAALRG